jgi:hypothetical protein
MDRISALRNVENALADFEDGDASLAELEDQVLTVLRTYATEFDAMDRSSYRAYGDDEVDGVVVTAEGRPEARDRVEDVVDAESLEFELEELG